MARPRLSIGTFGDITCTVLGRDRVQARARYRDWDGTTRQVRATADTQAAAERALKAKLSDRSLFQPDFLALTPDSRFGDLVAYWLADLDLEDRLSPSTRQLYERNMRTLVMPAFASLTLREIGVARCDFFLKGLAKQSHSRAKRARVVLRLALALAVRHEVTAPQSRRPCLEDASPAVDAERPHSSRSRCDSRGGAPLGGRSVSVRPEARWSPRSDHRGDARHIRSDR